MDPRPALLVAASLALLACPGLGRDADDATLPRRVLACDASQVLGAPCPAFNDHFGSSLALGHWDDDGVLDLAVGGRRKVADQPESNCCPDDPTAPCRDAANQPCAEDCNNTSLWRAWVFLGRATGGFEPAAALVVHGNGQKDELGHTVAFLPDVGGDGCDELVVGAPNWPNTPVVASMDGGCVTEFDRRGKVYVFFSEDDSPARDGVGCGTTTSTGGCTETSYEAETCSDLSFEGSVDNGRFGHALLTSADFDGDGAEDLVVGSPGAGESALTFPGAVDIYLDVTATTPVPISVGGSGGGGDRFGHALAAVGDLDGSTGDELLVGAPAHTTMNGLKLLGLATQAPPVPYATTSGYVQVVAWSGSGPGYTVRAEQGGFQFDPEPGTGLGYGEGFGFDVALGPDVSGDGQRDLFIGAPFAETAAGVVAGRLWVFDGDLPSGALPTELTPLWHTGSPSSPTPDVQGLVAKGQFGASVSWVGDLGGDGGVGDVAVGAWLEDTELLAKQTHCTVDDVGGIQAGALYVIDGDTQERTWRFVAEQERDHMGFAVVAADSDGDGVPEELVTGSPAWPSAGLPEHGQVYVYSDLDPHWSQWTDMGHALIASSGDRLLYGGGDWTVANGAHLVLEFDPAFIGTFHLITGFSAICAPFKGGVMVPSPDITTPVTLPSAVDQVIIDLTVDPAWVTPFSLYFQVWVVDAAGPKGFTATNALKGHVD